MFFFSFMKVPTEFSKLAASKSSEDEAGLWMLLKTIFATLPPDCLQEPFGGPIELLIPLDLL